MKIVRQFIKYFLRIMAGVSVLVGLFYFIAGTQTGLNLIWSVAEKMLPDKIHVGKMQGTLLSTLTMQDFSYVDDNVAVSIHELEVDMNAYSLIGHRFVFHDIMLNGVRVLVKPSRGEAPSSASAFSTDDLFALLNSIRIKQAYLNDVELRVGEALIKLSGTLDDGYHLQWSANIPDLKMVLNDLQGKLVTTGSITGEIYQPQIQTTIALSNFVSGVVGIQSLSGNFNSQYRQHLTNAGTLQVKGLIINDFRLPDFMLQLAGRWQGLRLAQQATIVFSPVNRITANIIFPQLSKKEGLNQTFSAGAKVSVNDFSQFKTLFVDVPEVKEWSGRVTGAFTGSGRLLHPVFDGGLQATNSSVFIPAAAMRLSDIRLTTRYHSGEKVILNGTFTAGQGTVHLAGTYGIEEHALPLELTIRGTDLLVKDTKEYTIAVSPDITLAYHDNDLAIAGKILVPKANIHPLDFSTTATLPSDVVIVNRQSAAASTPTNLSLRMQVVLGDHVKVAYRGLKAKLKGSITIMGEEGNPLTATGEFGIAKDGTYRAYGRSLVIQQGRLIYAGNLLTNPGISLRASQTIKKVGFSGGSQFEESSFQPVYAGADRLTVGIEVSGVIDKPRITLFSDPSGLSQGDILSYLLLGYPQAQAKGAGSLALLSVVSDMYGPGDKINPVNSLQQSLGLDELSVGTTEYYDMNTTTNGASQTHNTTTVNLGRNLGENLSVHYSVGIFQQIQVFSLRYQINRHLALQTETSTLENGGDLIYQLESRD